MRKKEKRLAHGKKEKKQYHLIKNFSLQCILKVLNSVFLVETKRSFPEINLFLCLVPRFKWEYKQINYRDLGGLKIKV